MELYNTLSYLRLFLTTLCIPFHKRVHYSKEIVNIQGLFVFTDGYVERTTYPLKKCYYFSTTINILFIACFLLRIKQLQMMGFQLILTRMISPCALITFDAKYFTKLIYTLVNRVLNILQNLLNFIL